MKAKEILDEVYNDPNTVRGRYAILDEKLVDNGYAVLGRQPSRDNEHILACKAKGHKSSHYSHSTRGSDESNWCDECKIFWKIDMSD